MMAPALPPDTIVKIRDVLIEAILADTIDI
jgi:hypothetical protein